MSERDLRFQQYLERLEAGEALERVLAEIPRDAAGRELIRSLELAVGLQSMLPAAMPATRRARMQAELQASFIDHHAGKRGSGAAWPRLALRVAALAAALVLVLGTTVVTSADSLPGELLYPVKIAAEEARLTLTAGAKARARLRLTFAETRMDELRRLMDRGAAISPAMIDGILASDSALLEAARAAGEPSLIEAARLATDKHRDALEDLRSTATGGAATYLEQAVDKLDEIHEVSLELEIQAIASATADAHEQDGPVTATPPATASATPKPTQGPESTSTRRPTISRPAASQTPESALEPTPVGGVVPVTLPPPTLVPEPTRPAPDIVATAKARQQIRRATRRAHLAEATARARALRATLEAVRATDGARAARATVAAIRSTERARKTERAQRTKQPPPRQTVAPIRPTATPRVSDRPSPTPHRRPPTTEPTQPLPPQGTALPPSPTP